MLWCNGRLNNAERGDFAQPEGDNLGGLGKPEEGDCSLNEKKRGDTGRSDEFRDISCV